MHLSDFGGLFGDETVYSDVLETDLIAEYLDRNNLQSMPDELFSNIVLMGDKYLPLHPHSVLLTPTFNKVSGPCQGIRGKC